MTVSTQKRVRLSVAETVFVTTAAEAERGPKVRTLVVNLELVQKAVAYAESVGWKNPDRGLHLKHLPRPAVTSFVGALHEALVTAPTAPSGPRARMSALGMLREYFAAPKARKQLVQLLDFIGAGGELTVEEV